MTAVEWLWDISQVRELMAKDFQYAIEIEKQQIIDANSNGWHDGQEVIMNMLKSIDFVAKGGDDNGEQYYTSTYGSKGSGDHIVDTNEMLQKANFLLDELNKKK